MPKLGDIPQPIDRSPKFTPEGQRVYLMNQREYTNWETFLSTITIPRLVWRVIQNVNKADTLDYMDYAPDPTVIVPTGKLLYEHLLDEMPIEAIEKRRKENEMREEVIKDNKDKWKLVPQKSRSEKVKEIDQRPKFTKDGERIILHFQRSPSSKLERFALLAILPIFTIWAFYKTMKAKYRLRKEGIVEDWRMVNLYLEDPTLIIPTGPSYYKEGELVSWEEVDKSKCDQKSSGDLKKDE